MTFLRSLADRITDWMVQNGGIKPEAREVHAIGLDKLLSNLLCLVIALIAGIVFQVPFEAIVFYFAYYILRIYAGGYHADSQMRCFILSIGIMIPAVLAIRFWHAWCTVPVHIVLMLFSAGTVIALAPVDNKKKRLEPIERSVYRKRALTVLFLSCGLSLALLLLSASFNRAASMSCAILCGTTLSAAMSLSGQIKNRILR